MQAYPQARIEVDPHRCMHTTQITHGHKQEESGVLSPQPESWDRGVTKLWTQHWWHRAIYINGGHMPCILIHQQSGMYLTLFGPWNWGIDFADHKPEFERSVIHQKWCTYHKWTMANYMGMTLAHLDDHRVIIQRYNSCKRHLLIRFLHCIPILISLCWCLTGANKQANLEHIQPTLSIARQEHQCISCFVTTLAPSNQTSREVRWRDDIDLCASYNFNIILGHIQTSIGHYTFQSTWPYHKHSQTR